jgi:hypothetical protein
MEMKLIMFCLIRREQKKEMHVSAKTPNARMKAQTSAGIYGKSGIRNMEPIT